MKKFLLFAAIMFGMIAFAQEKTKADFLLEEVQFVRQNSDELKIAWWIPTEYWEIALENSPSATKENVELIKEMVNDYIIIAAGSYNLKSVDGAVDFSVNDISGKVNFMGLDGKKVAHLKTSEISPKVATIVEGTLKPVFAQMLGRMGDGIEFFIYPNSIKGVQTISSSKTGSFSLQIDKDIFQWKLPLVSLMADKFCPVDKEVMKGNWIYCPFHGTKL